MGENEEDLDSTLSTGTRRMGQSKSNLVYKPSLPPAPEATAESRPPRATSSVRGFSPPRRSARRRAPQPPLTRAPRPAAGPRGRRAQRREAPTPPPLAGRGRCKRAGERGKALALPRGAPLRLLVVLAFRDAGPPRSCGAPAAAARRRLLGGRCPAAAGPSRAPRSRTASTRRAGLPCAPDCRVLGCCGELGCGGRRAATPLSPANGGAGRGAGAATSPPGIRPSARGQDPEPPPPSRLTSGRPVPAAQRPPVSASGSLRTRGQA